MRVNTFIAVGVVFAVIGLLGLTYIFPKMMCISGQDFVDQIDTSSGQEKYTDYSIGDTITISDSIARMELDNGKTLVWLETIGKSENDPPFRFGSDIMGDFGVGNSVIIKFEVVQDGTGDYTLKGYENGGSGLASDTITSRYSTCEYVDATCLTMSMSTPNSFNSSIVKFWNNVSANAKNEFFCLDGVLLYLSYVESQTSLTTSFFKSWNIPESAKARFIILNSVLNGFMSPHPCNTSGQVS